MKTSNNNTYLKTDIDNRGPESEKDLPGVMSFACLVCLRKRLFVLPLITAIWIIVSFFITYAIAVSYGHVEPDFPYISHTARDSPERCVFGQLINIGAVMLGMNVIVRYWYLKEVFRQKKFADDVVWWQKFNIAGALIGIVSALGISMVANFQTDAQKALHYVGAGLAFGLGTVYCFVQTRLSWKLKSNNIGNRYIAIAQLINSIALTVLLVTFGISKILFKLKEKEHGFSESRVMFRGVYLLSTISEWFLASAILTFALTYTWDFRYVEMESPKILLKLPNRTDTNQNGGTEMTTQQV
ncbi:DNA damage-regulated autophagy modulator protein 2-like isoform X2 [Mytilus trossulus]|uniref:DNA damage-regulated autophagy modulator protein 2-like isoform X2 n=1 Tax=Mytilus trossulus TaxID=6551 RepID=UPI0030056027